MTYKILKKYRGPRGFETIYELEPLNNVNNIAPALYVKNEHRQCMVGKNFVDQANPDMFTFSNETATTIDMQVLTVFINLSGYYQMDYIDKLGKTQQDFVHRVVCYSWDPSYDLVKHEVHHRDRNKLNNRADNLIPVPPLFNSAMEFKAKNPEARSYMGRAISDERKMESYSDLIKVSKMLLEEENHYVFNELSMLSKEETRAMIYVLEKLGYKIIEDNDNDGTMAAA